MLFLMLNKKSKMALFIAFFYNIRNVTYDFSLTRMALELLTEDIFKIQTNNFSITILIDR